ncbi:hypothetical protein DPMN_177737 [Dreissena polymorpha]|uniref:Uncharacterized protein n=1 Tax=Dreissena polymorpha TaxID=45954 RepID=A0A9D4IJ95_DREPO|nr:hypothetical protein DPMN_177737 [Dreissena polymorpha]
MNIQLLNIHLLKVESIVVCQAGPSIYQICGSPPPEKKNAQPPGDHWLLLPCPLGGYVFPPTGTIFELIWTNLLNKFHDDQTINVASRVKKAPLPGGHVFIATKTIFELFQDIIGTNLLTKFHEDQTINVTTRVLTRKIAMPPWWPYITEPQIRNFTKPCLELCIIFKKSSASRILTRKNALPPGSHVFQPNGIRFELVKDIMG